MFLQIEVKGEGYVLGVEADGAEMQLCTGSGRVSRGPGAALAFSADLGADTRHGHQVHTAAPEKPSYHTWGRSQHCELRLPVLRSEQIYSHSYN